MRWWFNRAVLRREQITRHGLGELRLWAASSACSSTTRSTSRRMWLERMFATDQGVTAWVEQSINLGILQQRSKRTQGSRRCNSSRAWFCFSIWLLQMP